MDIKERAEALREISTPGSRIGLTELSRSNAWRKALEQRGLLEIVDRADTAGYLVSVDSLNEMLDVINALESESNASPYSRCSPPEAIRNNGRPAPNCHSRRRKA